MCEELHKDWTPEWGNNHTWVAMDKNGKIAVMLNNGRGWLPKVLIEIPNISKLLDELCEYIDGDSHLYENTINKNGRFQIDLYPYWIFKSYANKDIILEKYQEAINNGSKSSDALLASKKGLFIFQAVEGYSQGEDYPVGYEGDTKMGDYFRFIVPTVYGSIDDIPKPLRQYIVVSDCLDFTEDRLLDNDKISEYFTRMYR